MRRLDKEGETELRGLLNAARSVALTREAAENLRERADKIAKHAPSEEVASLRAQIEQATEEALSGPLPQKWPRITALEEELEAHQRVTALQISHALNASGLARGAVVELQEAQALRNLLQPPLQAMRDRFEDVHLDQQQLDELVEQLHRLRDSIPEGIAQAVTFLEILEQDLREHAKVQSGRERLVGLISRLRALRKSQTGFEGTDKLAAELRSNAWIEGHPEDPLSVEGEALVREIRELAASYSRLEGLPAEVAKSLPSIRTALAAVKDAHRLAEAKELLRRESLDQAIALVLNSLGHQFAEAVSRATPGAGLETRRGTIALLHSIRGYLQQLPGEESLEEALDLERRCLSLAAEETEQLERGLLLKARKDLRKLAVQDVGDFAEQLIGSDEAALPAFGHEVKQRWVDLQAVRNVTTSVDGDRLRRLERVEDDLAPGAFALEAARAARQYRRALDQLDEIENEIELGRSGTTELLKRIRPVRAQFPNWRRAHEVEKRILDAKQLRAIKTTAAVGTVDGVKAACEQTTGITDATLRERIEKGLGQLEQAARKAAAASAARIALKRAADLGQLGDAIDSAVLAGAGYPKLESEAGSSWSEFPRAWEVVSGAMTPLLLDEIPKSVQRWLEEAVPKAKSHNELDELKDRFQRWSVVLKDSFLLKSSKDRFGRAGVQLDIEDRVAKGDFEQALAFVDASRHLLGAVETKRLRTELQRARAVHNFREGEDPDLSVVITTIRKYGLNDELLECVVADFEERGGTNRLAELARSFPLYLKKHDAARKLADWALLYERNELEELTKTLSMTEIGMDRKSAIRHDLEEIVSRFLESIRNSNFVARAYYTVVTAAEKGSAWPPEVRATAEASEAHMAARLLKEQEELSQTLTEIREQGVAPPPKADKQRTGDPVMRQLLDEAFEAARVYLASARQKLDSRDELIAESRRWLLDTGKFPRLRLLLNDVADLSHQLDHSHSTLRSLEHAKRRVLTDHPNTLGELNSLSLSGGKSVGLVARVFRLLAGYFRDWLAILTAFNELLKAHREGGHGMSMDRLSHLRERLEKDLGYDFRIGSDRFDLLPLLEGQSWLAFVEELENEVREIEEVDRYEKDCEAGMVRVEQELRQRLKRLDGSSGAKRERQAIASLLDESGVVGRSLRDLFANPPRPTHSAPAKEKLARLRETGWFDLLGRAASRC